MATLVGYTNTFKFGLINFDIATWHDAEWDNWGSLDTLLTSYFGSADFVGVWLNSTAYNVGNIATDNDTSTMWTCVIGHTSHVSDDFATERANNPSYWTAFGAGFDVEAAISARNDAESYATLAMMERVAASSYVTDAEAQVALAATEAQLAQDASIEALGHSLMAAGLNQEAASIIAGAVMTGATSGVAGAAGIVPQPSAGDQVDVLFGDATWKTAFGKQTVFLPALYMRPTATAGCSILAESENGTNLVMDNVLGFDAATEEHAYAWVQTPESYDAGTFTAIFVWKHPTTTVNFGVVWGIAMRGYGNGDAVDAALGTEVTVTDTGATTGTHYKSPETAAVTAAGTPAKSDMLYVEVARKAADGSDTLAVDANLLGVVLVYSNDALVDD